MDVPQVIRRRLKELGLEQKDLAAAAAVTESYISQLLARKKAPPAPDRTDIYDKIGKFLKLPGGKLHSLQGAGNGRVDVSADEPADDGRIHLYCNRCRW